MREEKDNSVIWSKIIFVGCLIIFDRWIFVVPTPCHEVHCAKPLRCLSQPSRSIWLTPEAVCSQLYVSCGKLFTSFVSCLFMRAVMEHEVSSDWEIKQDVLEPSATQLSLSLLRASFSLRPPPSLQFYITLSTFVLRHKGMPQFLLRSIFFSFVVTDKILQRKK